MSKTLEERLFDNSLHDVPNPFARRQFAFHVLSEEKNPMSRARKYSLIMPTLKTRLQQLITTRAWEYIMFMLSIWSFVPLLVGQRIPSMHIFFELTHELTQAALFIEVFCKLYADCRWFFYDLWNVYDLICVILNSPFVYNLFLPDHLGVPQMHSVHRLFRTLHFIRLIRIHSLLRLVFETILIALTNLYNILLLELVIVTVFALLSIAFESDASFRATDTDQPYANYTEALYSYYMCITLEGVNEVAEEILQLRSPQLTTVLGLMFYIFAALATYSVGQLLAAVIATILGKAMDRVTHDQSAIVNHHQDPKLTGLERPSISERKSTPFRCNRNSEVENFSQLKVDDLASLIILFQVLEKNMTEYDYILHDIRHIGEYIATFNKKTFVFKESNNPQNQLMNTLNKILHHLTDQGELSSALGEFLLNETKRTWRDPSDDQQIFRSIEKKLMKIENLLKKSSSNIEQNQRHLLVINQLKEKFFFKKNSVS